MCFSAPASFTAGAVLATAGVICIKKKQDRSQLMFSITPLIFAIQQFTEGFVWLLMDEFDSGAVQSATEFFLFFSLVLWPGWVPLSILTLEKNLIRRKILAVISIIGVLFSLFSIYYLHNYNPEVTPNDFHIRYDLKLSRELLVPLSIIYLIPTILPFFVSGIEKIGFIGLLIVSSHILSLLFFSDYILSVWCFFAALISLLVFVIVSDRGTLESHHFGPGSA